MKTLQIENVIYTFDPDDSFMSKDGRVHYYISFRKVFQFKRGEKGQALTVKPEHWEEFKDFMLECLTEEES